MPAPDAALHRHNQWRLAVAQLLSGVGIASGIAVGAVLVEQLSGSTRLAGFAQTATILGAAASAYPLARLATARGRRWALGLGFGLGTLGAVLVLVGVQAGLTAMLFAGLALFGGATAAGLQSRYAAIDFARPSAPPEPCPSSCGRRRWAPSPGRSSRPPAHGSGRRWGWTRSSGPTCFSLTSFALATLVVLGVRGAGTATAPDVGPRRASMADCLALAWRRPLAFLGLAAVVLGHVMMVAVMVMTPLHMHHQDMALVVVGIVISGHILGM